MTTRTVRFAFRVCVGAAILSPLGVAAPCLGHGGALGALRGRYPGVKVYEAGGRVRTVYGTAMTAGATPREAAQAWLAEHGAVFGTWPDLEEFRKSRLRSPLWEPSGACSCTARTWTGWP